MSLAQRKFFVVANKILGPKLFKTQQTVTKYQKLYPEDLTIEKFDTESQALSHLTLMKKEHERLSQLEKILYQRKIQDEKEKAMYAVEEENPDKTEEEPKNEFNIFYYFKENEDLFKTAQPKIDPSQVYHMFFDGASKYNPGPAGCGYAFFAENSDKIYYNSLNLGTKTNNQAEYMGLIYGFKSALNLGINKLHCYGDSQLVIKQMNGNYQVKSKHLLHLYGNAMKLKKDLFSVKFTSIPREENGFANKLATEAKFKKSKK